MLQANVASNVAQLATKTSNNRPIGTFWIVSACSLICMFSLCRLTRLQVVKETWIPSACMFLRCSGFATFAVVSDADMFPDDHHRRIWTCRVTDQAPPPRVRWFLEALIRSQRAYSAFTASRGEHPNAETDSQSVWWRRSSGFVFCCHGMRFLLKEAKK